MHDRHQLVDYNKLSAEHNAAFWLSGGCAGLSACTFYKPDFADWTPRGFSLAEAKNDVALHMQAILLRLPAPPHLVKSQHKCQHLVRSGHTSSTINCILSGTTSFCPDDCVNRNSFRFGPQVRLRVIRLRTLSWSQC